MRSTPTAVTQSLRLAFRLKPSRSVQSECTLFLPASIRMYVNSSGAVSGETKLPHHAFHSAICINCSSSSLIRNSCLRVSSSIIRMSLVDAANHIRIISVANLFQSKYRSDLYIRTRYSDLARREFHPNEGPVLVAHKF